MPLRLKTLPNDGDEIPLHNGRFACTTGQLKTVPLCKAVPATEFVQGGLAARWSAGGMYVGRIISGGNNLYFAEIFKYVGGTPTVLSSQQVSHGTGTLRFDLLGSDLRLYLDGQLVGAAEDSDAGISSSGGVGLFSFSANVGFDAFTAASVTAPSGSTASLPFTDNFNDNGSTYLNAAWTADPSISVAQDRLESTANGDASATVNGISTADVTLGADVNLSGSIQTGGTVGLVHANSLTPRQPGRIMGVRGRFAQNWIK